ncbi:MAG: hypothetical protein HYT43_01305 [Candidatus Taylorbacteria bacterium]|nr:hypothetical protein [Candidatus Taylorbacteria bacterium]
MDNDNVQYKDAPARRRIGAVGAIFLIGTALVIDGVQILLDLLVAGVAINRVVDIVVGVLFALWFLFIDPKILTNTRVLAAFFGTLVGEAIPLVDAAPLWTLDICYVIWQTRREDKGKSGLSLNPKQMTSRRTPPKIPAASRLRGISKYRE